MQINEFLEKFLPDYKARLNKFRIEEGYAPIAFEVNGVKEFCVQNFPEALQNFADIICEKQRENCGEKVWCCISENDWDYVGESTIENYVLTAEQPKIEEL